MEKLGSQVPMALGATDGLEWSWLHEPSFLWTLCHR